MLKMLFKNQLSPPSSFRSYQPNSRGRSSIGGHGYHHSGSVNKPLCHICGKAGHIDLKSFHRFDMNFQNSPSSSKGFLVLQLRILGFLTVEQPTMSMQVENP